MFFDNLQPELQQHDMVYNNDIQWWSLDEMVQWADSWERVYQ